MSVPSRRLLACHYHQRCYMWSSKTSLKSLSLLLDKQPTSFSTYSLAVLLAVKMHLFCWGKWHLMTVVLWASYKSELHYINIISETGTPLCQLQSGGADVPTVYSRYSQLQRFRTSDLEWTTRRCCFGADIFKFPAST